MLRYHVDAPPPGGIGVMQGDRSMSEQAAVEQDDAELAPEELDREAQTDEVEASAETEPETTDEGEVSITLGDDSPSPEDSEIEKAPVWVKELRKSKREADKRIRELESKLNEASNPRQSALATKPTLADFGYDEEAYAPALEKWVQDKAQADAEANRQREAQQEMQQAFEARRNAYQVASKTLRVPDFEDAEAAATEALTVTQQGIIINGAEKSAELMYALGKNPTKAKELASIKDPIKFAFAVAKLETQMKVQPRKTPPPAERRIAGNASASGDTDGQERRLREAAEKSGDYSKLFAFKRDKQRAA